MNSSDSQTINNSTALNDQQKDDDYGIFSSKRDIFLSTYRRQRFTFRNSIMHYIAKNPKNTKVYQKMGKCCKYFFIKNSVLLLSHLKNNSYGWKTWVNQTWKSIDINRSVCKLWITDELQVIAANVSNASIVSSIIPKIYRCEASKLFLSDQVIFFNEFMFLCSSVKDLTLNRITVINDDNTVVLFEKLVENLFTVKKIFCTFTTPLNNTSKNTFKKLWKIPHLSNYDYFELSNIPEDFDIDSFYSSMKKNKKTRIYLLFSDKISEEYKTRLETIIDEIVATRNHEYKPPFIDFAGLD